LLGYLLVPAVLAVGLLLIPIGMWREARRRRHGRAAWAWPTIDLGASRTRVVLGVVALLTLVNLGIIGVAGEGVIRYTESNEFCGQVCHTPMRPESTAHAFSAHARVDCVSCHVSSGASGFLKAKLNGTRQLALVLSGRFARPIPEPLSRIPVAADTCWHCHTPGRPDRETMRNLTTFGDDEKNTEGVTSLTLHLGVVHWHARPETHVEYVATDDKRQTIPYIRVTGQDGKVTEYLAEGTASRPSGELRRMDCITCHNRPAHTFSATADRAVDGLLASHAVSLELPFVRREIVAALKTEYGNEGAADAGIAKHLTEFYRSVDARLASEVPRAVTGAQQLYRRNVFPDMKVTWGTYTTNLGHVDAPGCFRCHDDNHKTKDGKAIRQDCELCHKIQ
jgi:nitrate/TMAO reductase-like tetraheme cytochrome c subunit